MANSRPDYIAMPPGAYDSTSTPQQSPGLPSPRVQHVAGAFAPALSPLDVFAAQSRALAKQLEEQQRKGERSSRLPPLVVKDGLARKPQYFRAPSLERRSKSRERRNLDGSPTSPSRNKVDIEEPAFRPKSLYTTVSNADSIPDIPQEASTGRISQMQDEHTRPIDFGFASHLPEPGQATVQSQLQEQSPDFTYKLLQPAGDYFAGIPRSPSPEPISQAFPHVESVTRQENDNTKKSFDSLSQRSQKSELDRDVSTNMPITHHSHFSDAHALRPPNPPYARKTPSIRSVDSEDENAGGTPSPLWEHRKMSSSSGFSAPQSPVYSLNPARRSPSLASESSFSGHRPKKPSYNFSRPMSRAGRPSTDWPSRMSTADDAHITNEDGTHSMESSGILSAQDNIGYIDRPLTPGGSTHVYSTWSLPRGRLIARGEQSDASDVGMQSTESLNATAPSGILLPTPPRSLDLDRPTRSSLDIVSRPTAKPMSKLQNRHSLTSMKTTTSDSTIKASQNITKTTEEITAEEHLNKGIECHEKGSLNESTYHLRLAARQNNPTAMLLYALACRHGWGMRPNPSEGVAWLRKAMDCASIELANENLDGSRNQTKDIEGIKARKAQFALSMYELGVSHMNGWGVVQDKALALRCFEIASDWGDGDAMSEAGFCYAQGVGCKKDLKKAAHYYRSAEAKGVSMVGNSWYVAIPLVDAKQLILIGYTNPNTQTMTKQALLKTRIRMRTNLKTIGLVDLQSRTPRKKRKPEISRGRGHYLAGRSLKRSREANQSQEIPTAVMQLQTCL